MSCTQVMVHECVCMMSNRNAQKKNKSANADADEMDSKCPKNSE